MSVAGSGRWIWYRSIQSVPRRRSESSTSRMIQRREFPLWFGSSHGEVDLRRKHDVVTAPAGQRLADDDLRLAVRVDVSGIDEVDPRVERPVDDPDRIGVVRVAPRAEHHRAETELADRHAGASQ